MHLPPTMASSSLPSKKETLSAAARDTTDKSSRTKMVEKLDELTRSQLVSLASATIQGSESAANIAEQFFMDSNQRMEQCVRCHCKYDPLFAGPQDCQMEMHCTLNPLKRVVAELDDEGGDLIGDSEEEALYNCSECGQIMSEDGYGRDFCWSGRHISSWDALPLDTSDMYWGDKQLMASELKRVVSSCNGMQGYATADEKKDEATQKSIGTTDENTRKRKLHREPERTMLVSSS